MISYHCDQAEILALDFANFRSPNYNRLDRSYEYDRDGFSNHEVLFLEIKYCINMEKNFY